MKDYLNRCKYCICFTIIPIMMFGLVGPLEIYVGNKDEFLFGIKDFLPAFVGISMICLIVLTLILGLFKGKVYRLLCYLMLAVSVISYIQNTFLNSRLYDKAGNAMNWSNLKVTTIINTIIWIIGVILLFILFLMIDKDEKKIVHKIAIFFALFQFVILVSTLITNKWEGLGKEELVLSGSEQFVLGSDENIIVIVCDAYSRDEFIETSDEYPEAKECFKDFTFYNNNDSHYNYTVPAMMHLLTGEFIDYNISSYEWKINAWNSDRCQSFYSTLHDKGYICRLYSSTEAHLYFGDLSNLQTCFDNFTYAEPRKDTRLMVALLEKMALYKYAPYAVKPALETMTYSFKDTVVYDHTNNSMAYDNYVVADRLRDNGIGVSDTYDKTFTIMHIQGNHFPYNLSSDGYYQDESEDDVSMRRGVSVILQMYFDKLKEVNLYDSSTIIVLADHGKEFSYYKPQPIYFIKRADEHHDTMQISTAPITHDDFQATIMDILGEDYSKYGTSIYDWKDGDRRERQVNYSPEDDINVYTYYTNEEELVDYMKNGIYEKCISEYWNK